MKNREVSAIERMDSSRLQRGQGMPWHMGYLGITCFWSGGRVEQGVGGRGKPRPEPSLGGMASQGRGDILELASMNDSSRLWVLDWSLVACFLALG